MAPKDSGTVSASPLLNGIKLIDLQAVLSGKPPWCLFGSLAGPAEYLLALNKIDLIPKPGLLSMMEQWSNAYAFEAMIPISAAKGTQVDDLLDALGIAPAAPPGQSERSALQQVTPVQQSVST